MGRRGQAYFQFQQFLIAQDRCAMKVGTDGMLLGAWTSIPPQARVLDIGTGTGLVALMLAQRSPQAQIDALEVDLKACEQARENVACSPWIHRIQVHHQSLQAWIRRARVPPSRAAHRPPYTLIVANPPYFPRSSSSTLNPRTQARQQTSLSLEVLFQGVAACLHPQGQFSMIYPFQDHVAALAQAQVLGLHCTRLWQVKPRPQLPPKRSLLEFSWRFRVPERAEISLEHSRHCYTADYAALLRPFLLRYAKASKSALVPAEIDAGHLKPSSGSLAPDRDPSP
ncbi:tRNA1(Val) (adenine(37)-N6)-methyltransferase [Lyngbya confervoides]|uniref:tRNA1(Val) (adenine(37)-N6)-methyltransferase n=1 Tax=Lyngbya confervoides BDU141951 TaxID=1574623 RepID=A0ABD4T3D0_9CYAN|nr:methyltransferase [Lyngbya confervoides]MCM1982948.1 methyltransferase [Lyngbya confervoides BDU141951]